MHTLTREQAAYWAGVIDGEGCISIYQDRERPKRGCTARIHIANTNRAWLEQLHIEIGAGKLSKPRSNGPRARAKPLSSLWFTRPEMEALLLQIRPYLRMKLRQADLLSDYFATVDRLRAFSLKRTVPEYAALALQRDDIVLRMKALNQRGYGQARAQQPTVAFRKCGLASCGKRHFCKGYCRQHYRRYVESGGPVWLERSCQLCGKPYVAQRKTKMFCSGACGHSAWMAAHREQQVAARREARQKTRRSP